MYNCKLNNLQFCLVACGYSYIAVNEDDQEPVKAANSTDINPVLPVPATPSTHPFLALVAEYSISLPDFFLLFDNFER